MKNLKLKYLKTFEEFQGFIEAEKLFEEMSNDISYIDKFNIFKYLVYPVNDRNYFNILHSISGEDLLLFKEKSTILVQDYIKFFLNGNITAELKTINNSIVVTISNINFISENKKQSKLTNKIEFTIALDESIKNKKSILNLPIKFLKVDGKLQKVDNSSIKDVMLICYLNLDNKIVLPNESYIENVKLCTERDTRIDIKSIASKFKHNNQLADSFNSRYETEEESINKSLDKIETEESLKGVINFKSQELQKFINKKILNLVTELFRDLGDDGNEIIVGKKKQRKRRDRNAPRNPNTFPWEFDRKNDVTSED